MNTLLSTVLALFVTSVTASTVLAQAVEGDAKAGADKIASCIGCHNIAGYQSSFPEIYRVPKISGQNAKYLSAALVAYQKGDRKHPTMRGTAVAMTEQDIADISAYYEASGRKEGATAPAKAPAGNDRVAALLQKGACASCHGDSFSNPIDPSYPKIAGQHADYLFVALKSYKVEGNAVWGRNNAVMAGISRQFSNAELKELSRYLASIPGELRTVPQPRFR